MSRLWHETEVLSERYLEITAADAGNTLLLLLQAPFIAGCIVVVWRDVAQPTDACYFVMALTAVWFGAINACREIVKERPVFRRERMVGLDPRAYLLSKVIVLSMLGFLQCLALVVIVNRGITLSGSVVLHFITLYAASLAGSALGLCLSALVSTSERAVTGVPLLLLPQILFSSAILSHEHASDLVKRAENATITAWAYDALKRITAPEPAYGPIIGDLAVVLLMAALLTALASMMLQGTGSASS